MPFVAAADVRVEDDRARNDDLNSGELELQMRRHDRAEPEAHGEATENEVEDMAAAIRLREVRREPVGPAVGLFEEVEGSGHAVGVGAAQAEALPFFADLFRAMLFGDVTGAQTANTR